MASKTPDGKVRVEPTITLGPADRAPHHADFHQGSPKPVKKQAKPVRADVTPTPTQTSAGAGVNGGVFGFVVVLLLAVIAVGGWFFYQQMMMLQQELGTSKNALQASTSQLGDLETRLSDTDQALNQTGDKTAETLKFLDTEVRKLWAVSNKRNKEAIAKNKQQVASVAKELKAVSASMAQLKSSIASANKELKAIGAADKIQSDSVQKLESTFDDISKQLGQQKTLVSGLQKKVKNLGSQDTVVDKVSANSRAIESIDAYRRQTNSSIEQIKKEMRSLYQQLPSASPASQPGL